MNESVDKVYDDCNTVVHSFSYIVKGLEYSVVINRNDYFSKTRPEYNWRVVQITNSIIEHSPISYDSLNLAVLGATWKVDYLSKSFLGRLLHDAKIFIKGNNYDYIQ